MGTRANVIITDEYSQIIFYRHSDGYPECTGESLKEFVKGYGSHPAKSSPTMRLDAMQSAGWLVIHGHNEYGPQGKGMEWKVGAYEPTANLHGDAEYIYVIDLKAGALTCRVPKDAKKWWDKPTLSNTKPVPEFKVSFGAT